MKKGLVLLAISGISHFASAQVGVGTTTPDASAQLQIESANKGILIPRVTNTSVVTAPANGLMVYQTGGIPGFYYNSGTSVTPQWLKISTGVADSSITNAKVSPTAAIAYSKLALTNSIVTGDITAGAVTPAKISTSGATSGQVLGYDGISVGWTTPASGGSSSGAQAVFSATLSAMSASTSTQLTGWSFTSPYFYGSGFNQITGDFTVPETGTYQITADVNYSTTAAITVSLGAGINPSFVIRRTAPVVTDLATGLFPVLNVNVALVLTLRTILESANVPLSTTVKLMAGDVIGLYYVADGLTVPLTIGGQDNQGVRWSVTKLDSQVEP